MKKKENKAETKSSSKPEKIGADESLSRMKDFTNRKEQIIADIRTRKN
jgi:hypothetical protein